MRQGLTQDDLIRRADVSLSTLQTIERDRPVKRKSLRLVAEALGMDITELDTAPLPGLANLSDEDLAKELRRRHGWRAAEFVRSYLEDERKAESASRSDNGARDNNGGT